MCNNEGILAKMNVVAFYSNTGQSKAVAEYVAKELNFPVVDIESVKDKRYENLYLLPSKRRKDNPPMSLQKSRRF